MAAGIGITTSIVPVSMATVVLLMLAAKAIMCVPTHFTDVEQHFRNSIDLDAEQTEARYDQEMLSDIINDNDRGELQKAESCLVDDYKYDHGQKIQRLDPCEICLCIDGEIFCWWKQCDTPAKAMQDPDQIRGQELDQGSSESFVEVSTITSTMNTVGVSTARSKASFDAPPQENGSTRLTLADSLSDGGTTVISSTLPISTPSSRGQNVDRVYSETVTHHGTVHTLDTGEGIPKNILTFPQTPPIMMYRPSSTGPIVNPSFRDGKSIDGGRKTKLSGMPGMRKVKGSSQGRKKSKEHKKPQLQPGGFSSDIERKPTVSIASDALPKVDVTPSGRDAHPDQDQSVEDLPRNEGQANKHSQEQQSPGDSLTPQQQFGGYGFGMIREPELDHRQAATGRSHDRDVPQHYIITSSGHVEMFDDSGTIGEPEVGTENQYSSSQVAGPEENAYEKAQFRDVLSFDGRVSSRVAQEQPANGSAGDDVDTPESDEGDGENGSDQREDDGGPVAPAIMLTTNVTQGKYSLGEGQMSTPSLPVSQTSVIDILNSTTLETDYMDGTNHSELIYPEVPSIGGSSSSGSSSTTRSPTKPEQNEQHCVVMGVTYPVGAVLKQETGNCLQCVCVAGPENDPAPRVTCTPLNCPPLILPDILDGAGF